MAKITLDLNRFKASGVYTIEFDASERIVVSNFSGSAYSGSLFIQGLGTFADTGSNSIVDLGSY